MSDQHGDICYPGCSHSIKKYNILQSQDYRIWEVDLTQPKGYESCGRSFQFFINEETGKIFISRSPMFNEFLKIHILQEYFKEHNIEAIFVNNKQDFFVDIDVHIDQWDSGKKTKELKEFALKVLADIQERSKKKKEEEDKQNALSNDERFRIMDEERNKASEEWEKKHKKDKK